MLLCFGGGAGTDAGVSVSVGVCVGCGGGGGGGGGGTCINGGADGVGIRSIRCGGGCGIGAAVGVGVDVGAVNGVKFLSRMISVILTRLSVTPSSCNKHWVIFSII